jgi:hypothetical protein
MPTPACHSPAHLHPPLQVMYNIVNFLQRDEGADREGINARPDAPLPDKAPLPLPVDPNAAKQALDALD